MMLGMGARRRTRAVLVAVVVAVGVTAAATGTIGTPAAGAPPAGAHAAPGDRGTWQVRATGDRRYEVSWRSPSLLPTTDARPVVTGPASLRIGVASVGPDRRTVTATVVASAPPRVRDLDVVLSGDRLDARGDDRLRAATTAGAGARLDLPGTVTLPDDPGATGPFDVTSSDYQLAPVKLPGMPEPIEMVGHVVEPAADAVTGPRPLVLFLHGRHSVCYDPADPDAGGDTWPCQAPQQEIPSQLGYDYIQQVLASQGYATVSIRVNGINAQDYRLLDGGADARAAIVERHLDHWADIAAAHQVDMSRVVLVGHSRGGEGVDRASLEIPLSAPYRVVGQVLIAPTDFGNQTAPYVPTVTLLPFCDGDVSDLEGQRFTDVSRDLTTGDTSLKSSVLVMGANHNFFNTEWTPGLAAAPAWDDWYGPERGECGAKNAARLTPQEQQAVGTAYVAGAVHLFADDDQGVLPLFDGSRARVASLGDAQTLSHAIGGGRDVRAPQRGAALDLPDDADTRMCTGVDDSARVASCTHGLDYVAVHPHWSSSGEMLPTRSFFQMTWTASGQAGGLVLRRPLDLTDRRLELRTIADPGAGPVDLRVRITDGDGHSAVLTPAGGGGLPLLGKREDTRKYWAQALVVDPSAAAGVDLADVTKVDLVSHSDHGRVWVADLAAAPATLAPVPDRRLATVDIGRTVVPEGDGDAPVTVRVPFSVHGGLTAPARIVVATVGQSRGDVQRFPIDLAPGQTSGWVPVTYQPNRVDDYPRTVTQVSLQPVRGVMTDSWAGALWVVDDDPAPRVTVRAVRATVREGASAKWEVRLSAPTGYGTFVSGRVVRGPRPTLSVADVPRDWLAGQVGGRPAPTDPLWKYHPSTYGSLDPGETRTVLSVPTVRDGRDEGRESVTLRIRVGRTVVERTVWVR